MANYKIVITKKEVNNEFKEQLANWEEQNKYYPRERRFDEMNYNPDRPRPENVTEVLVTELSEEQYKKVKLEVLKAFE